MDSYYVCLRGRIRSYDHTKLTRSFARLVSMVNELITKDFKKFVSAIVISKHEMPNLDKTNCVRKNRLLFKIEQGFSPKLVTVLSDCCNYGPKDNN